MQTTSLKLSKYTGCGNDFIIIDNRTGFFPCHDQNMVAALCEKKADGLILLENSSSADYKMRIFNSDGKETEMCGNGLRCLIRFLEHIGDARTSFTIETFERILKAENRREMIAIEMGDPTDVRWNETLKIDNYNFILHHLNTGVPHAVTFINLTEDFDVEGLGSIIRHHPHYFPKGANANFAEIQDNEVVLLRTFERGVEKETLACGTGATATALAAAKVYGLSSPIAVQTRSNEILYVSFSKKEDAFTAILLTGPATHLSDEQVSIDWNPSFCVH